MKDDGGCEELSAGPVQRLAVQVDQLHQGLSEALVHATEWISVVLQVAVSSFSHFVCLEFISCLYSVCCISLHSKDVFTLATIPVVLQVAVSSFRLLRVYFMSL